MPNVNSGPYGVSRDMCSSASNAHAASASRYTNDEIPKYVEKIAVFRNGVVSRSFELTPNVATEGPKKPPRTFTYTPITAEQYCDLVGEPKPHVMTDQTLRMCAKWMCEEMFGGS